MLLIILLLLSIHLITHFTFLYFLEGIENPFGNDHFPVVLENVIPLPSLRTHIRRWKLDEADGALFGLEAVAGSTDFLPMSPEVVTLYLTEKA